MHRREEKGNSPKSICGSGRVKAESRRRELGFLQKVRGCQMGNQSGIAAAPTYGGAFEQARGGGSWARSGRALMLLSPHPAIPGVAQPAPHCHLPADHPPPRSAPGKWQSSLVWATPPEGLGRGLSLSRGTRGTLGESECVGRKITGVPPQG